jgi:signal transduction histidine kinase
VLRDRAEAARAGRERALLDERARIARELHDVVAHALSFVAVQTQAVRRQLDPDQERQAADLHRVEGAVREAMVEMRRLLGVLRTDGAGAPLAPQPGLADLAGLMADARAAGLDVREDIHVPTDTVSAGLGLTVYRIVQEALTNVRRHARARNVTVSIHTEADALSIEVVDDGVAGTTGEPGHGWWACRNASRSTTAPSRPDPHHRAASG